MSIDADFLFLKPSWEVPNVRAFTVLALSGKNERVSFDGNSTLGAKFRKTLERAIDSSHPITWLRQIHGDKILQLPTNEDPIADGSYTFHKGVVCEVITADCLPVVFTNRTGTVAGIAHAGRRGLYNQIIANLVRTINVPAGDLLVWIGPGISLKNYVISKEIRDQFLSLSPEYSSVFHQVREAEYGMDLNQTAKIQLTGLGIPEKNISGAEWDTFSDDRFHSARRDKDQAGRMVTVAYME